MLDRRYGFHTMRQDASNEKAIEVCRRMCEDAAFGNVLWVFGPSGCGKTHLLKSAKNAVEYGEQQADVLYATARELTGVLVDFISGGTNLWVLLQEMDFLLVDNVEYLAGRTQTQQTFADMITAMCAKGKKVVLASVCSPEQVGELWGILCARLEHPCKAPMYPPSKETKENIARAFLETHPFAVSEEMLQRILEGANSILQLNGLLNSAYVYSAKMGMHIDEQWLETCARNFDGI